MDPFLPIKSFVRETLGCSCPADVFEQIEDRLVQHPTSPHTRVITIGGRLLIFIWIVTDARHFRENLLAMLAAGRKERDENALNRFRAVLAVAGEASNLAAEAESVFAKFPQSDDRMHLHVISRENLPF